MSATKDHPGPRRRRARREGLSDYPATGSPPYVRLVPTSEQAMADEAHAPSLSSLPPEPQKSGGLRFPRGGQERGHNFDDRELYGRMHRDCRRIYARAFGAICDRDWDEAFNFAYGQGWRSERDKGPIDRLATWLTTVAHNAVVSEHRKTARVDLLATEELFTEQAVTDLAETVDDRQILRDAIFCLKASLPDRVRLVWTMRFAGDYEPGEIQQKLQISRKAYEKDLELASRLLLNRLESARKSGICDTPDMTSMVRAYAMWGEEHGAERAKLAREHLGQCPACRQTVRVLRAAQRAAVFLPPPILTVAAHHQSPLSTIWQVTEDLTGRIQDGLWRITERVHEGLLRMRHVLINIVSRSPSSSPVNTDRATAVLGAGSTGGTALVTKALAGCLAVGVLAGGTGACLKAADVGVPGLGGLIHSITHVDAHHGLRTRSAHARNSDSRRAQTIVTAPTYSPSPSVGTTASSASSSGQQSSAAIRKPTEPTTPGDLIATEGDSNQIGHSGVPSARAARVGSTNALAPTGSSEPSSVAPSSSGPSSSRQSSSSSSRSAPCVPGSLSC